ncbi:hypothetical protein BJ981_002061 [Sphaerisporangium krabiense]|uniref:Uncharacterized protein n=1 Tax=Sphaerisporangium krabiense TaxID=763782 RepID=A0A7W9DPE9_9ACTN|nr:hypothetical protein [Sphaerisporangium krabiense]
MYRDAKVAPYPWLALVHADSALPEWWYGQMTTVTF